MSWEEFTSYWRWYTRKVLPAPSCLQMMLLQFQWNDVIILAKTLPRCLPRISSEIKLDMWVDYIAFNKFWIEKYRYLWTTQDLILGTVHQLTQQLWPHKWRYVFWIARRYWYQQSFKSICTTYMKVISQHPKYRRMQGNICIGQVLMQTDWITQREGKNV